MPISTRKISELSRRGGTPPVRRLSRTIYLLLYLMILVREGQNFFGLSHDSPAAVQSDLRDYLMFAILALVMIRVMAFLRQTLILLTH